MTMLKRSGDGMRKVLATAILVAGFGLGSGNAMAQSDVAGRVDRLEHEMRAVQRKVFPNGVGQNQQVFEPEITGPQAGPGPMPGSPASSPIADLASRVTALETQMSTLTGQAETSQHRLQQLEDAFTAYKLSTNARIAVLEGATATPGGGTADDTATPPPTRKAAGKPATTPPPASTKSGVAASADSDRAQKIAAIQHSSTGDDAHDAYLYGYRLWQAKYYPEAETALKDVVTKYPKSKDASYAQNLLGRSYLDEGKPSLASLAFYDNYKKMPQGDRAPDSLYYLAQALVQLKKPSSEVCKVYDELNDVYGASLSGDLKAKVSAGRAASKCQ